ncbi:MAG: hypothetical protein HYU31_08325 [Deltaproteobacteria bacterium]|nr:hypothetical protein [Deltaproteobacteria bacterium]MBI3067281.1 hypothetical protein [Deltaproteobacteria bacterium]
MKALTIDTIERNFPNQWLLIEVTETKGGVPFRGVVLEASERRQQVVKEIGRNKGKKLFFFYSGIVASPKPAFAL